MAGLPPSVYAPPLRRLGASLLDAVALTALQIVLAILLGRPVGVAAAPTPAWLLFDLLVGLAYYVGPTALTGQTLGKFLLGIRVVGAHGPRTWGQILLRETIGRLVCALTLGLGYLPILWDAERRGLHDRLADTRVVRALGPESAVAG